MRFFMVLLTIVIGASLTSHVSEAGAAASSKIIKKKARSIKKTSGHAIDVWTRIRSGMKIPNPVAVNMTVQPGRERSDAAIPSVSSPAATKIGKGHDGVARLSKSKLNGISKATSAPAADRYTELGRAKFGQKKYTERGRKLLGAKTSSIADVPCTPSLSVKKHEGNAPDTDNRIAALKRKGQMKISDASTEIREGKDGRVAGGSTSRLDRAKVLVALSRPARADGSENKSAPCTDAQLAAIRTDSQPSRSKGKLPETQEARAGQQDQQATVDERIDKFVAAYTRNPDFLNRVAERGNPYLYHIVEKLSQYGLPLELALLPIVESAYQPTAESSKSAKGLWQFIPSTGTDYNLAQSHDYDERLDVLKSTHAAIRFLSGLKNRFNGDWLLALAAYNSGQLTVENAINQNRAEGLPTDFWSLNLPEETRNYVPRLLALAKIIDRPSSYGIKLPSIKNEPYFVEVKIDREFDVNYLAEKEIALIAQLADLPHDRFRRLNPAYLGANLPRRRSYVFLLPLDNANQLRTRLASIAQFMSVPVLSLKSVVRKEKPEAYADSSSPALFLVGELLFKKPDEVSKYAIPFLSLNVDGEQSLLRGHWQALT